jgi:hypothetical protein
MMNYGDWCAEGIPSGTVDDIPRWRGQGVDFGQFFYRYLIPTGIFLTRPLSLVPFYKGNQFVKIATRQLSCTSLFK